MTNHPLSVGADSVREDSATERCPAGTPPTVREFGVRDASYRAVLLALALLFVAASTHPEEQRMPPGVIQLDETVISGNQELPKVLYILPWRQPDGLPDIEVKTEFTEMEVFRRLYPPAYRRELSYFETLDGNPQE